MPFFKRLLLFLALSSPFWGGGGVSAQNFPVECRLLLAPPFSGRWSDFTNSPNKLRVQLLLKDQTKANVPLALRVRLKGAGIIIQNPEAFFPAQPLTLALGSPQTLSPLQLPENFEANNLESQGIDLADLLAGQPLPFGVYEWEVVAIELFRNRQVSNVATARFLVLSNQPPLLNQPRNNAQIAPTQPQNLLFSWTPRHTTAPTGLVYHLYLYELPPDEDPAVIVNSGLPAVQHLLSSQPSFLYGPTQLPLTVGQRYAWQVRVESLDEQVAFANNGLSDVGSFVYGAPPCPPPAQAEATVNAEAGEVLLRWQPPITTDPPVQGYLLTYAAAPSGLPTQRILNATEYLLLQLPAGQPYQWRVQSVCPQGKSAAVAGDFALPAPAQTDSSWISDPQIAYEPSQDPLPSPEVMKSSEYEDPSETESQEEQAAAAAIDDILNTPVKIFVAAEGVGNLPEGLPKGLPVLDSTATLDQLKAALNIKPPDCAGIAASYVCGNHDAVPQYSGEIIPAKAGDELAMNSLIISVVDIDGSGNGQGLIEMPMMNNIKLGVRLEGIKVAEGGCVVAGKAELSGVDVAVLNDQQRAELQKAYAAYNQVLDVAAENAGAIAETYNSVAELLKAVREKAKVILDKIAKNEAPTKSELNELEKLSKKGVELKQKELEKLKLKAGADTMQYVAKLSAWIAEQQQGIECVTILKAEQKPISEPKKGGPSVYFEGSYLFACDLSNLTKPEPVNEAAGINFLVGAIIGGFADGISQFAINFIDEYDDSKTLSDISATSFQKISVPQLLIAVGAGAISSGLSAEKSVAQFATKLASSPKVQLAIVKIIETSLDFIIGTVADLCNEYFKDTDNKKTTREIVVDNLISSSLFGLGSSLMKTQPGKAIQAWLLKKAGKVVKGAGSLVPSSLITKLTQSGATKLKAWTSGKSLNYKSLTGASHTGVTAEAKIFEDLESAIGNKNVLATLEDGQGRLSVVLERPGQTHQVVTVHPTSTGELKMTTFEPAYNPKLNTNIPVPASANKLSPNFASTQYLHPLNQGKVIKIKMSGKRTGSTGDFSLADFEMRKLEPNFVKPSGYTWHHLDDFNPTTGECTMQLVESTAHQGSGVVGMAHSGSVAQWKAYYGTSNNAPNGFFYQQ